MQENRGIIDRFIQLRNNKGITQANIGKLLGISDVSISRMESGQTPISEKHIKLICGVFGINEEWLRTGNGSVEKEGIKPIEEEIINIFRELSPKGQNIVMDYIEYVLNNEKSMQGITDDKYNNTKKAEDGK